MAKKMDLEKAAKKVEGISNTVDIIMKNRLIIAFFLIVDGVTFLMNPNTTLSGMAQNIILLALLAALSVFLTNLAAKDKDIKTIVITAVILAVGGFFYFYPDLIAAYIQLILALFIIFDGLKNIANALHLNKLTSYTQKITEKYNKLTHRKVTDKKKLEQREKLKEVDDNLNNGLDEQANKMISPLKNIIGKTSKFSALYVAVNIISVTLGIVLLIFPDVSMMVWGLIFLYTGTSNLIVGMRTMELTKKIKERRFKEIIFDAKKEGQAKSDEKTKKSDKAKK
ncbi:hypothetical protein IKE83_01230 [Candidatus Saccharibacteria bacterium]|nr:hypothetical protein [Candidatus Saccharibacteria bacterium]